MKNPQTIICKACMTTWTADWEKPEELKCWICGEEGENTVVLYLP
jgi:hypothetical protein